MSAGIERCQICNLPLTTTGQCLSCGNMLDAPDKNIIDLSEKNNELQTVEKTPVDSHILPLKRAKKSLRQAYLFNGMTAERFEISNAVTRIGRDRSNNVIIADDPHISRHHAWILQDKTGFWIEDLGSTNTTLLNGKPVQERNSIKNRDKLTFGKTEMTFFAEK